jgi:hypothetical protein
LRKAEFDPIILVMANACETRSVLCETRSVLCYDVRFGGQERKERENPRNDRRGTQSNCCVQPQMEAAHFLI